METVKQEDIEIGLRELGLKAGDTVVVHSSLSCFGRVDGGADAVVDALLAVVGEEGTLVVPTFTYGQDVFDASESPSLTGAITEAVRKRSDAARSLHPSHSVAAIGKWAEAITEGHERVDAFARGSALFKVLQANGRILQLGTTHTTNSMIHVAEEIAGVPYLDRSREVAVRLPNGKVVRRWIRRPGCSRGFDVLDEILHEKGEIAETWIGKCKARLMSARAVVDAAVEMLKTEPSSLLCERPDCEACAQARAMISVTEAEKQDQEVIELARHEEQTLRLIERQFDSEVRYFETENNHHSPN